MNIAEYGSWESPINAELLVSGNCKAITSLQVNNGFVYWIEQQFPDGRCTIFQMKLDGIEKITEKTPKEFSIKNAVHEYGGGAYTVAEETIYFTSETGIFRQNLNNSEVEVLIIGERSRRFADLTFNKGSIYAVCEIHHSKDHVENLLVRVSEDGTLSRIAFGADFYASPRVSADSRFISWMEWDNPNMPWDDTRIVVAELDKGGDVTRKFMELSEKGVNFQGNMWDQYSQLYVICDRTNWWNVYKIDLDKSTIGENIYCIESEIGGPQWQFGDTHYAINDEGILMNVSGMLIFKWLNGNVERIDIAEYNNFSNVKLDGNNNAFFIASGPKRPSSVLRFDIKKKELFVIRESFDGKYIDQLDISVGNLCEFISDDMTINGWYYPPFSKRSRAPNDTLPPGIIMAHGGPTGKAVNSLDLRVQYFTSRGFAIFDVNYRGSTGFGTSYRNLLRKNWGILDRNDIINAGKWILEKKLVDPHKLCIMGSSASGFLLLAALTHSKIFSAAASLYGICDLLDLIKSSHKFEKFYNEQLIAKYPEEIEIYKKRSPITNVENLYCPVAFFHGENDPVVSCSQSELLHNVLKTRGLDTSLVIYPGEGHGFRSAYAITNTINSIYSFFCRVLGIKAALSCEVNKVE